MRVLLLVSAMAVLGCSRMQTLQKPGGGSGGGNRGMPGASATTQGSGTGLARKAVHGKQDPVTLVAADGTRCPVTEKRYRETAIGEVVWCQWRL